MSNLYSGNAVATSGPMVALVDPEKKKTEKTSAQVYTHLSGSDSRLYRSYDNRDCCEPLTYWKIRQYRKDPTASLAKWAIFSQMDHTPWVPVNYRGKASKEMMDYIEETLTPLRTMFLMQASFGTLDFGWQSFEVVYKPENGYIYIDNFKPVLQDFTDILVYVDTGGYAGFVNQPTGFYNAGNVEVTVTGMYALNTNFVLEGTDFYGESVYENIYKICDSWSSVEKIANRYDKKVSGANWVIYYPVGRTPINGVDKDNLEVAQSILNTMEANGCTAIPDELQEWMDDTIDREAKGKWRIELLTAKDSGQSGFIDRQKYLDVLKIRGFGFAERSILEGKHGTKEDAAEHGDISLAIIDSKHHLLTNALNLYTLPKALELNFGKKMMWEAGVKPAPLVDSQFNLHKEIYRTLLQDPRIAEKEFATVDMGSMKQELGIPMIGNGMPDTDFSEPVPPKIEKKEEKVNG